MLPRLSSCEIKSMSPAFRSEMLIRYSQTDLDEKILFDKIIYHLDPEFRKYW